MQKTFRCLKYDLILMRKRCIERQDINKDDFEKKADFPGCTRNCAQGRKILKALGGAVYLKKIQCDEPGCKKPARSGGKCSGHASKAYRNKLIKDAKNKEKTMGEKKCELEERYRDDKRTVKEIDVIEETNKQRLKMMEKSSNSHSVKDLFKDHPEMLKIITAIAVKKFRTIPMQILYILDRALVEDIDALKLLREETS